MKKILAVDNDQFMLKFITNVFSEAGHKVITAEDGLSALDILETYTPDVIFIDLVMPNINGRRLCKIIRGIERLKNVKIVILSAVAAEEVIDFDELGANGCIPKGPFEEMAPKITAFVDGYGQQSSEHLPEALREIKILRPKGITEELLSVKRHFEIVLEKMSEGILEITSQGRIVYANPTALSLIGLSEKKLLGSHFIKLFDKDDHKRIDELMKTMGDKPVSITDDFPVNLNEYQVTLSILPINEPPSTTIVILNDVTERKTSEKTLKETNKFLRNILDSSSAISIMSTDLDQNILFWNKGAENMFGYKSEEVVGLKKTDILYPGDEEKALVEDIRSLIWKNKKAINCEIREVAKDGRKLWINLNLTPRFDEKGNVVGILGIGEDISERKRLEEQLRQAQKMEAIGTLAGGIAHDFNNILGIIIGNTELAIDDVPEWNPAKGCLEEIRSASLRAKDVVRHILSFARQSISERKPIQITSVIKDSLKLLRASIPTAIEIRQIFSCEHDTVMADPTQINQVLMNLCTNASHAMREEGGVLEVSLQNVDLELGNEALDLEPGRYLKLSVSDTGPGIDSTIIDRVFDPYFTTKGLGEGTGMGLSVVHGIVKNHDGAVMVKSEPGKGAVFEVFFPLTEAEAEAEDKEAVGLPTGDEKILLVDDEESLVKMAKRMLEMQGYQVETRSDPVEALELFRSKPDRFDLVITDMTMPNITGDRLANEILSIRPDMPIILCSGFSEKIDAEKAKKLGIRKYIEKPLNLSDFVVAVRKVLDPTLSKREE